MALESGTNIYHAVYGLLSVDASNDHGQMFCIDEDDFFYLVDEDDEAYSIVLDVNAEEDFNEEDDEAFAQSCITAAVADKAMLIVFDVDDETTIRMITRGVDLDESYEALSTLRQVVSKKIFSDKGLDN